MEMEIKHELEEVRKTITSEKSNSSTYTMRLITLRGKESALVHVLDFMSKNMKRGGK